jgi:hypothetical protein
MIVRPGEAQVFVGEMAEPFHGIFRRQLARLDPPQQFAQRFAVHEVPTHGGDAQILTRRKTLPRKAAWANAFRVLPSDPERRSEESVATGDGRRGEMTRGDDKASLLRYSEPARAGKSADRLLARSRAS